MILFSIGLFTGVLLAVVLLSMLNMSVDKIARDNDNAFLAQESTDMINEIIKQGTINEHLNSNN